MKARFIKKSIALALVIVLLTVLVPSFPIAQAAAPSGIDPAEFVNPGFEYRPGVRWWWSLGSTKAELLAQVKYMAENNFGMVEINPWNSGYMINTTSQISYNVDTSAADTMWPDPALDASNYQSPEWYDKLESVIALCNDYGIIVDLNMGSGYLASHKDLPPQYAQGNKALGRQTIAIDAEDVGVVKSITIPDVEISPFYMMRATGAPGSRWTGIKTIQAVLVAPITSRTGTLSAGNRFVDLVTQSVSKTYTQQFVLDMDRAIMIDLLGQGSVPGDTLSFTPTVAGDWEVVALYTVPAAAAPIRGVHDGAMVVDHMDADAVKAYFKAWIDDTPLGGIVDKYDIRAAFNDSLEFYNDMNYNSKFYAMAKDPNNIVGYDMSKFMPIIYRLRTDCFTIGTQSGAVAYAATTAVNGSGFLHYNGISSAEMTRITNDYNHVKSEMFMEGMESFANTLGKYGMLYRQQAYNHQIDTLKASRYSGIPETEGSSETSLRRISSGAHLYGKNLVTCEEFTLGNSPFSITTTTQKTVFDTLATSGVNNFFYHGLSSTYWGSPEAQAVNAYGEHGWRAWPDVGIEVGAQDSLAKDGYTKALNTYTSRANYLMQSGKPSMDVAVYMPYNGNFPSQTAFDQIGYNYDAINDDVIQNELDYIDGRLVVDFSGLSFGAIVVPSQTVPVKTMEALKALAQKGAPIIFQGNLPNAIDGYANGNYAAVGAQVNQIAQDMQALPSVSNTSNAAGTVALLEGIVTSPIKYNVSNSSSRHLRRTLETGGELTYIRNTSATAATTVQLKVDSRLKNLYWLDQNTGKIHRAEAVDGVVTCYLPGNGAIGFLAEPEGVEIATADLEFGMPVCMNNITPTDAKPLTDFTLSVTADNIGSTDKRAVRTEVYTGANALGNWNSTTFNSGDLRYVSDKGTYTTSFTVDDEAYYLGRRVILDMGTAYSPVTVTVNGKLIGKVLFAPYVIDIASALRVGDNTITIEMQPLGNNRRVGFRTTWSNAAVGSAIRTDPFYHFYGVYAVPNSLQNTGVVGPVQLYTDDGGAAAFSIQADESAFVVNTPVSYTVSVENLKGVNLISLSFTAQGDFLNLNLPDSFAALNGFSLLGGVSWEDLGGNLWKGSVKLMYPAGFVTDAGPLDILAISGVARNVIGDTAVTLTDVAVSGNFGNEQTFLPSVIGNAEAATSIVARPPVYSKYDLNRDGRIDDLDLGIALFFYLKDSTESDWETPAYNNRSAKEADVTGDGLVDLADLIEIIANYRSSYNLFP